MIPRMFLIALLLVNFSFVPGVQANEVDDFFASLSAQNGSFTWQKIDDTHYNLSPTAGAILEAAGLTLPAGYTINIGIIPSTTGADSNVLIRITGGDGTDIYGFINCDGYLYFVDPHGITIHDTAIINALSAVFSTRDILNADFINGNMVFNKMSKDELDRVLVNNGKIIVSNKGFCALIAGAIENNGIIIAKAGTVALAAGDAIKLEFAGNKLISVAIPKKTADSVYDKDGNKVTDQIKNTGTIDADGGLILLNAESLAGVFARSINLEGYVRARSVDNEGGVVRIKADGDVRIGDAVIDAGAADIDGKRVVVEGDGATYFYGDAVFNNFECTKAGKHIFFGAGKTYKFNGRTHIGLGHADWPIYLSSTEDGKPWYIDVEGDDYFFDRVFVKDSYNVGPAQLSAHPAINGGNNVNWLLNTLVWKGTEDDDWSNPHNWDPWGDPSNQDIEFTSGSADSTIDLDYIINSLKINGYTGTIRQEADLNILNNYSQTTGNFFCADPINNTFNVGKSFSIAGGMFNRYTGAGTSADPYMVRDIYDLQAIKCKLNGYYRLANNIDASSTHNWYPGIYTDPAGFMPIGTSADQFIGTLDGDGYTVDGLYIFRPGESAVGLFSYLGAGTIQDLGLVDASITGRLLIGGFAARSEGTIENCYITGKVTTGTAPYGPEHTVGAIVGYNWGKIIKCYSTADVFAKFLAGGIAAVNEKTGLITESFSTGNVAVMGAYAGGAVGINAGNVNNCYSTGTVTGVSQIGGFIGVNTELVSNVAHSYSTGSVSGTGADVGGFFGRYVNGTLDNNFWDTQTSGWTTSAGQGAGLVEGKTTAQMQTGSTFTDAGWDFYPDGVNDIWHINDGNDYPNFYYMYTPQNNTTGGDLQLPGNIPELPEIGAPGLPYPVTPIIIALADDIVNIDFATKYKKKYARGKNRAVTIQQQGDKVALLN